MIINNGNTDKDGNENETMMIKTIILADEYVINYINEEGSKFNEYMHH